MRAVLALLLVFLASPGCRRDRGAGGDKGGKTEKTEKIEKAKLGEVLVGKERTELYVAYSFDAAILGLAVSTGGGPARHFPLFASTYRGIPPVVVEVLASKSETELWVRSSWPDHQILGYRRVGTDTALTQWGEMKSLAEPMPDHLSGGPLPFPELVMANAVKKGAFKHE